MKMKSKERLDDILIAEEGNSSDPTQTSKTQQKADDTIESSSTRSDGGKGAGSGGGYSADYSSSDTSSDDVREGTVPETEMKRLTVSTEKKEVKAKGVKREKKMPHGKRHDSTVDLSQVSPEDLSESKAAPEGTELVLSKDGILPQWNGVRIHHPMDPRIDLSTVGHIQTSSLSAFPSDLIHAPMVDCKDDRIFSDFASNSATPSIDQYMSLLEVVRPFFYAHGFSHFQSSELEDGNRERHASCALDNYQNSSTPTREHIEMQNPQMNSAEGLPTKHFENNESCESDSASMVVLARVKRKHSRNKSADDRGNGGSNDSSIGSNVSSTSSSEKRVRIQHPVLRSLHKGSSNDEEFPAAENESNEHKAHVYPHVPNENAEADRQESTSASSSESQNNVEEAQNPPLGFAVPVMVSEYSSSRTGSSGASNNNQMSTSGSGSGGHTGSGTGSGSNQGGSSGSGNDQGGISSNGHGSSASGHDVKGSGEETMDNSGENNSGEGNSDATKSNRRRHNTSVAHGAMEPTHSVGHRHYANMNETTHRDLDSPTPSSISSSRINSIAVRERKLLDKKRKRMNMRREYEEKVQQEMESSEGSHERDENMLLKPGKPVTLDKVLSFTKVPRIVVNATPPFLVVHTNAAYCRLSGIDSHTVVGKPISSLLRIPDPQTLAEVEEDYQQQEELKIDETHEFDSATGASIENHELSHQGNDQSMLSESRETQGLSAAAAAGRARAASSQEDSVERLIATSGFGRYNIISLYAKPLLGSQITMATPSENAHVRRSREEGSNGSSITSIGEGSYRQLPCSMGVSPVVSSPEAFAVVVEKEQESHHHKTKRRKHHLNDCPGTSLSNHPQSRRNFLHREVSVHRKRHLITHYVIQLEALHSGSRKLGSLESQSSTSTTVEAQVLGMTKSELQRQRGCVLDKGIGNDSHQEGFDVDAVDSESSNTHEAVTAVG